MWSSLRDFTRRFTAGRTARGTKRKLFGSRRLGSTSGNSAATGSVPATSRTSTTASGKSAKPKPANGTLYATGSRVICPESCRPDSDWDFIALVEDLKSAASAVMALGFEPGGSLSHIEHIINSKTHPFLSFRRGEVNLMLTQNLDHYEKFCLATRVCKSLKLAKRPDRVTVFEAITRGNG